MAHVHRDVPATIGEAALEARTSDDTIRRAFDAGILEGVRTASGLRLIDRASLVAFIQARAEDQRGRRARR
jgi:hypothetical protein